MAQNSYSMSTCGLPDMYTLSSQGCGPQDSGASYLRRYSIRTKMQCMLCILSYIKAIYIYTRSYIVHNINYNIRDT